MSINLDQVLHTFIDEARELLQEMESGLLGLEQEAGAEVLDAIFRAAHTIKGSAGLFGLDPIVDFTHVVEDVLDRLREGKLAADAELVALLLAGRDHIEQLVDGVARGEPPAADTLERGRALLARLQAFRGGVPAPVATDGPVSRQPREEESEAAASLWHLSLRFGPEVLRNGMDPLSFLRYLGTMGRILSLTTLTDAMPAAAEMDPESCYLGFELDFQSEADKAAIAEVFDFVRDDCELQILPHHGKVSEYIALIRSLPEDDARLGEILVASGALTRQELEQGLAEQAAAEAAPAPRLGEVLVGQQAVAPVLVQTALEKQSQGREQKKKESRYIRVQADKLDELINLVGELVIAGAGVKLLAQRAQDTALQEATSLVSELMEEIRDGALRLRMVPIGDTFNRFQRVVHDVSQELGKDIALHISGADTELDKTVIEKIGDPLMHLLRNAMDHGIETPAARLAAGKPATGNLRLNAFHDAGSIVIEIADDGAGLDRERILQKAMERELVPPGTSLSEQEVYQLIFEPGFSTADTVTNLSGRGVGMDVVRRNILALRGRIDLDSRPGQGTRISIRLPLTLAIIDGFLVGVGGERYVVPLDTVQECIELSEADRRLAREHSYLNLRGEVLPLIKLGEHFGLAAAKGRRENVVVVQCAGQKAGLVVDELLGEHQTVIKPLGKLFGALRGIGGSTILGDGSVALILDVSTFVQAMISREGRALSA
ncbi:chemotaxis protein CheA [Zobellella denitrificans]|uniref:chemotaxis protein CheA n=1 Tax=Zobellella denitrificans TaxID=347534 RepID=UPI000B8C0238|nr:chemotaxis protein CheA [Zobellella denitrificans]OXS16724.1 chemotaxis protein CheA [Zobellella denitrificans]